MESFLAEQQQLQVHAQFSLIGGTSFVFQKFIESALNTPETLDAIHPSSFITTPRIKSHLELELKKKLQHYAHDTYGQNSEFESFLENGKQLVDLSIRLSLRDELDATFPLLLLEEFFEFLPVFLMKNLFDWMVSKRHLLLKVPISITFFCTIFVELYSRIWCLLKAKVFTR